MLDMKSGGSPRNLDPGFLRVARLGGRGRGGGGGKGPRLIPLKLLMIMK